MPGSPARSMSIQQISEIQCTAVSRISQHGIPVDFDLHNNVNFCLHVLLIGLISCQHTLISSSARDCGRRFMLIHSDLMQAMMEAVMASKRFQGTVEFTGQQGLNVGKLMSNDATRRLLDWEPKYQSYAKFIQDGAEDMYSQLEQKQK